MPRAYPPARSQRFTFTRVVASRCPPLRTLSAADKANATPTDPTSRDDLRMNRGIQKRARTKDDGTGQGEKAEGNAREDERSSGDLGGVLSDHAPGSVGGDGGRGGSEMTLVMDHPRSRSRRSRSARARCTYLAYVLRAVARDNIAEQRVNHEGAKAFPRNVAAVISLIHFSDSPSLALKRFPSSSLLPFAFQGKASSQKPCQTRRDARPASIRLSSCTSSLASASLSRFLS